MIKLKITDAHPLDAKITIINGDEMFCYFEGDREVIDMEKERADEMFSHLRLQAKEHRTQTIKQITVVTSAGRIFNGDETSQQRIHRAIEILADGEVINWTLADNTVTSVTREELREALRLAVLKQAELWSLSNEK